MGAVSAASLSASASKPHSRSAPMQAISPASRFPLSTVEMNAGVSGRSVRVSYQLYQCPMKRGIFSSVTATREMYPAASSRVIISMSQAATAAAIAKPMFVGDVRCAVPTGGCS